MIRQFHWPELSRSLRLTITLGAIVSAVPLSLKVADWPAFGGQRNGGQYSTAQSITKENVDQLERAWTFKTGDLIDASAVDGGTSFQATPVLWNGNLFFCTPLNRMIALDAVSGDEVWSFDAHEHLPPEVPKVAGNCRGVAIAVDQGAAFSKTSCAARVFRGDIFGNVFAVDARTGKLCPKFGDGGILNINGFENHGRTGLFLTSPAAIFEDLIILGSGVGDNMFANADDGIVRALNSTTGEMEWAFNPIPPELSSTTGGANVWSMMSVDEENGLVFLPTSSPSVDPYGAHRKEAIPFANSVVALDARSGEPVWHQQLVRHDLFDYDVPSQPILSDLEVDGLRQKVVIQITKMGFVFVFDRLSGEPIFPITQMPVPPSDVEGEAASPTQPVPTKPAPFARQSIAREDVWGITPWELDSCLSQFDELRNDGLYTPPSLQGTLQMPSALGGANWGGAAYDAANNLLVVKTQNLASIIRLIPADPEEERELGSPLEFLQKPLNQTPYRLDGEFFMSDWGIPCTPPPWGELVAIDLSSGDHIWKKPLGRVPFGPFHLSDDWGSPNVGGPMITAGDIIFIGAGIDNAFRAIDPADGDILWSDTDLPAPVNSVPITYELDGEQYVVVTAGGNALAGTDLSDSVIAYRLAPERSWWEKLLRFFSFD